MKGVYQQNANISATKIFRELKLVSIHCYDNALLPYDKIHKESDLLVDRILIRTLNISKNKLQNNGGCIPTEAFIAQQLKAKDR